MGGREPLSMISHHEKSQKRDSSTKMHHLYIGLTPKEHFG